MWPVSSASYTRVRWKLNVAFIILYCINFNGLPLMAHLLEQFHFLLSAIHFMTSHFSSQWCARRVKWLIIEGWEPYSAAKIFIIHFQVQSAIAASAPKMQWELCLITKFSLSLSPHSLAGPSLLCSKVKNSSRRSHLAAIYFSHCGNFHLDPKLFFFFFLTGCEIRPVRSPSLVSASMVNETLWPTG